MTSQLEHVIEVIEQQALEWSAFLGALELRHRLGEPKNIYADCIEWPPYETPEQRFRANYDHINWKT